ncbi:formin-F-like [Punica granatum]|uniref:Uncharacterized protein n=2 Tax=Punica granatum TaxID=22663 RepID=A0A2I0I7M0_PUNGR|nr:formin-F-like [Punica granatum]PKI39406.1 hypothetical protein CRG98_040204 [Punica granatum]
MEIERSSHLSWAYCSQDKSMEDLRHCLLCTSLELESTKAAAQQELRRRDDELAQLRGLLERVVRERDEAQGKYQKALLQNLLLQQQMAVAPPISGVSSVEDIEPRRVREKDFSNASNGGGGGFSSSECEDSIVSSPVIHPTQPAPSHLPRSLDSLLLPERPLPEKGKLLQTVMKAGPLLKTLLLAGPLPQWRHPPPPLESSEIPPVKIPSPPPPPSPPLFLQDSLLINTNSSSSSNPITSCGRVCSKMALTEGLFDFPAATKYQRVALP